MLYKCLEARTTRRLDSSGRVSVVMSEDLFKTILRAALVCVRFDEQWYLRQYTDVASAVLAGKVKSGFEHYLSSGYFEGRLPYDIAVDKDFYVSSNVDVRAAAVADVVDVQDHFRKYGAKEGRAPSKGFTFFRHGKSEITSAAANLHALDTAVA